MTDKIELWDDEPYEAEEKEPKWTWYVQMKEGVLMYPIIQPCNFNWKLRWTRNGRKIKEEKVKYFTPNKGTHSEFYMELLNASKSGVQIKCLNCCVDKHSITAKSFVDVKF